MLDKIDTSKKLSKEIYAKFIPRNLTSRVSALVFCSVPSVRPGSLSSSFSRVSAALIGAC